MNTGIGIGVQHSITPLSAATTLGCLATGTAVGDYTITNPNSTWSAGSFIDSDNPTGTTGFGNLAYYTAYKTSLVKWEQVLQYILPTLDANSHGLAVGIRDLNTSSATQNDTYVHFVSDTGANQGKILFYTVGVLRQTSSSTLSIASGDEIKLTVERSEFTINVTVENITQSLSITDSYLSPSDGSAGTLHQMGSPCIWNEGGNHSISTHTLCSNASNNADVVFVGDSITVGYDSDTLAETFRERFATDSGLVIETVAAPASGTDEANQTIQDAVDMNGTYYVLMIGGNNAAFGDWDATRQGYYNDIVTAISAVGTVIHLTPTARDAVDVSAVDSWIKSNHGTDNVISLFDESKNVGLTTLKSHYDDPAGDGTHPNECGHELIYTKLVLEAPELWTTDPRVINTKSWRLNDASTDEYITFGDVLNSVTVGASKTFTIEGWIKVAGTGSNCTLISKFETTGNQRQFAIQMLAGGSFRIIAYEDGSTANSASWATTGTPFTTAWHHWAVTYDQTLTNANKVKLYVDGVLQANSLTLVGAFVDITTGTAPLVIGGLFVGGALAQSCNANFLNLNVFNVALNATEVSEAYNSGTPLRPDLHSQAANLVLQHQADYGVRDCSDVDYWTIDADNTNLEAQTKNMEAADLTTTTV